MWSRNVIQMIEIVQASLWKRLTERPLRERLNLLFPCTPRSSTAALPLTFLTLLFFFFSSPLSSPHQGIYFSFSLLAVQFQFSPVVGSKAWVFRGAFGLSVALPGAFMYPEGEIGQTASSPSVISYRGGIDRPWPEGWWRRGGQHQKTTLVCGNRARRSTVSLKVIQRFSLTTVLYPLGYGSLTKEWIRKYRIRNGL